MRLRVIFLKLIRKVPRGALPVEIVTALAEFEDHI
jgi:hypothetical protein